MIPAVPATSKPRKVMGVGVGITFIVLAAILTVVMGFLLFRIFGTTGYEAKVADLTSQVNQLTADKASLTTKNAELDSSLKATTDTLTTTQNTLSTTESKLSASENNLVVAQATLGHFKGMLCTYTWNDAWNNYGVFATDTASIYDYFTQYQPVGALWNSSLPSTTILVDMDGNQTLIIDTEKDCVVLNPSFWSGDMFH